MALSYLDPKPLWETRDARAAEEESYDSYQRRASERADLENMQVRAERRKSDEQARLSYLRAVRGEQPLEEQLNDTSSNAYMWENADPEMAKDFRFGISPVGSDGPAPSPVRPIGFSLRQRVLRPEFQTQFDAQRTKGSSTAAPVPSIETLLAQFPPEQRETIMRNFIENGGSIGSKTVRVNAPKPDPAQTVANEGWKQRARNEMPYAPDPVTYAKDLQGSMTLSAQRPQERPTVQVAPDSKSLKELAELEALLPTLTKPEDIKAAADRWEELRAMAGR
jgi:hypothetical protein